MSIWIGSLCRVGVGFSIGVSLSYENVVGEDIGVGSRRLGSLRKIKLSFLGLDIWVFF